MALFELTGTLDEATALAIDRWLDALPSCIVTLMESEGVAPRFGEPGSTPDPDQTLWSQCEISVLVDEQDHDPVSLAEALYRQFGAELVAAPVTDAGQDWEAHYRAQVTPLCFAGGFRVVPPWEAPPVPEPLTLVLEPNQAFGSGRHPTTRMCLEAMSSPLGIAHDVVAGATVLDYGCGSGILAMAALRLGASAADAIDIDPVALECAAHNLAVNQLSGVIRLALPDAAPSGPYGLILANILLNPLCELAPQLTERLKPDGLMLLTGLLAEQAAQCRAAYPGMVFDVALQDGDWILLAGRRRLGRADPMS